MYVGFVRAVMLGRAGLHRQVLLDIVEEAGGWEAASYITTGNVSFRCEPDRLDEVVVAIEHGIERVVERPTPVMVRPLDHLVALVAARPFSAAPHPDPKAKLVGFVRARISAELDLPIDSPNGDFSVFAVDGGEIFSITIDTGGRVQDPGGLIERLVGEPLTTRAWGTVERIVAKLAENPTGNSADLSPGKGRRADPLV